MKQRNFGQKTLKNFWSLRDRLAGLITGLALLAAVPGAQAALIPGFMLADTPDILIQGMSVGYNADTRVLGASGFAIQLDTDAPGEETILDGDFTLVAAVSNAGALLGGNFEVTGTIPTLGYNSGVVLTGSLTALGFDPAGGDPLQFVFDVTGGDAAGLYPATAGILMTQTDFPGDWGSGWASDPLTAVADIAPIPVPAAAWLFGSALLGLVGVARRRAVV